MPTLYLDLDGVFADFISAVYRHTHLNYTEDPIKAWQAVDKIPQFYQRIYPLPGALSLFDTIKKQCTIPIEILTALPDPTGLLRSAPHDKECWVHRYMSPDIKVNTVQGWEAKALFAFPGCILVDDSARNISDWVTSGGTGVHHTSNWNTLTDLNMLGILN